DGGDGAVLADVVAVGLRHPGERARADAQRGHGESGGSERASIHNRSSTYRLDAGGGDVIFTALGRNPVVERADTPAALTGLPAQILYGVAYYAEYQPYDRLER